MIFTNPRVAEATNWSLRRSKLSVKQHPDCLAIGISKSDSCGWWDITTKATHEVSTTLILWLTSRHRLVQEPLKSLDQGTKILRHLVLLEKDRDIQGLERQAIVPLAPPLLYSLSAICQALPAFASNCTVFAPLIEC